MAAGFDGGHPDLGFLAAVRAGREALAVWDALLPRRPITGFAGSDIHQNTNLIRTYDGERLDSYRRLGSWFSNYLLVGERTRAEIRAALQAGRVLLVFDVIGQPEGVDFAGLLEDGSRVEMGGEVTLDPATRLVFRVGAVDDPVEVRLYRVHEGGPELVLTTDGDFEHTPDAPGAWRVEVSRTPLHLAPELGALAERFVRPTIWLYTNPVYVR